MNKKLKKLLLILNSNDPTHITYSLIVYYRFNKDDFNFSSTYKVTKWKTTRKKDKETKKYITTNIKLHEVSGYTKDILSYLLEELELIE